MEFFIRVFADGTLLFLIFIVGVVLALGVPRSQWKRAIPVAIMAGMTSLLVGKLLSLVYQPKIARPFMELGQEPGATFIDNPGFPSDHALLATVLVVAVFMLTRFRMLGMALAVVVILMSIARVLALVHTPLDVVGGILAGIAGIFWYFRK